MQQLPKEIKSIADEFQKKIESVPTDKRTILLNKITSVIAEMNQDIESMIGVIQTAKDKKDIEELKEKMQGNSI